MQTFFHKSDLDGHCSGAIVYQRYPQTKLTGIDYNSVLDRKSIKPNERVYVLDFCFPKDDMLWLHKHAILIWCDHHKTSMNMMEASANKIAGFREIGRAGCELTWEWLHAEKATPWAVWAIGRHDVWDHAASRHILPFQYGLRQHENIWPDSHIWKYYFETSFKDKWIQNTLFEGNIILKYEKNQNTKYAKAMSYESDFMGLRAIVMNKPFSNSMVFESVYNPDKHDLMILFSTKEYHEGIKYSLYSDKPDIDVSVLAKKMGGGGHKGAAGFYAPERVV